MKWILIDDVELYSDWVDTKYSGKEAIKSKGELPSEPVLKQVRQVPFSKYMSPISFATEGARCPIHFISWAFQGA